mmetsp:Transcript_74721/g.117817  ORF Transcript_74721/g.117817 Transcript_74721/m.117817 type:complete len:328 (-) Transcript_74721:593-1576(-)
MTRNDSYVVVGWSPKILHLFAIDIAIFIRWTSKLVHMCVVVTIFRRSSEVVYLLAVVAILRRASQFVAVQAIIAIWCCFLCDVRDIWRNRIRDALQFCFFLDSIICCFFWSWRVFRFFFSLNWWLAATIGQLCFTKFLKVYVLYFSSIWLPYWHWRVLQVCKLVRSGLFGLLTLKFFGLSLFLFLLQSKLFYSSFLGLFRFEFCGLSLFFFLGFLAFLLQLLRLFVLLCFRSLASTLKRGFDESYNLFQNSRRLCHSCRGFRNRFQLSEVFLNCLSHLQVVLVCRFDALPLFLLLESWSKGQWQETRNSALLRCVDLFETLQAIEKV